MRQLSGTARDLLPIVAVIAFFQLLVVGEPLPELGRMIAGLMLVLAGLTLFLQGLAMSLLPLGENLTYGLARRGSLTLLLAFAFALGFGSTVAEPALLAVVSQAAGAAAASGVIADDPAARSGFALLFRYVVAAGVGLAVAMGALRIVMGWPLIWMVLGGYALAALLVLTTDSPLHVIALDAGAAATSAINIPLITALGTGLATMIRGRNPLADGLGLIALASLTPMLAVLFAGLLL